MHLLAIAVMLAFPLEGEALLQVKRAKKDIALSADPTSTFWKGAAVTLATHSNLGVETSGHRTEIRARWTESNLYVLASCPYEDLYLNSNVVLDADTNKLWEHDVVEIFIGADFENIHRYRELQLSPQGEWIDLDVDQKHTLPNGMAWNSGMKTKARLDRQSRIWYAEFQIPLRSISDGPLRAGSKLRANFYRFQGPPPNRKSVAWSPTGRVSNHTPDKFGTLVLVK